VRLEKEGLCLCFCASLSGFSFIPRRPRSDSTDSGRSEHLQHLREQHGEWGPWDCTQGTCLLLLNGDILPTCSKTEKRDLRTSVE
jgi:hypothetical protein